MDLSPPQTHPDSQRLTPRLLVSVRNASEAQSALEGGCEILDIKEPGLGSLGRAPGDQMRKVLDAARRFAPSVPVSAALGEATEWLGSLPDFEVPSGLAFVKMGTAGLGRCVSSGSCAPWIADWERARVQAAELLSRAGAHAVETRAPARAGSGVKPPAWIVVAYADWQSTDAPSPASILEAVRLRAFGRGCGLLIDTHAKRGQGLFDWMTPEELSDLAASAAADAVPFALAGSLGLKDLPALRRICPGIVGIRTAACCGGHRNAPIDRTAVRTFLAELRRNSGVAASAAGTCSQENSALRASRDIP